MSRVLFVGWAFLAGSTAQWYALESGVLDGGPWIDLPAVPALVGAFVGFVVLLVLAVRADSYERRSA